MLLQIYYQRVIFVIFIDEFMNMKKMLNIAPEAYFIGIGAYRIFEGYLATGRINYVALLVIWLVFLQVFYKNRVLGLIYGGVLALLSVYRIYEAVSGYYALEVTSFELIKLCVIFTLGLVMSIIMIYRYMKAKERYDESVLTVTLN